MPEEMEITTGQGLQFKWNGTTYFIGNRKLFREQNIPIDLKIIGKTVAILFTDPTAV